MDTQTFRGESLSVALAAVKKALGPDAIVLTSRTLRKPGLFGRLEYELIVAPPQVQHSQAPNPAAGLKAYAAVERPKFASPLSDTSRAMSPPAAPENDLERTSRLVRELVDRDVEPLLARRLANKIAEGSDELNRGALELANPATRRLAQTVIAHTLAGDHTVTEGRIQVVVGPTGVGKTTSVAKLAAKAALVDMKNVAVISADTYRLGGIAQLSRYCSLMRVPFAVLRDDDDVANVVTRFAQADVIFVDTAGYNPKEAKRLARLAAQINESANTIHLALSTATRARELRLVLKRYSTLNPNRLLFTKLDEATSLGTIVNASMRTGLPIAYVAFGQKVPEDISTASPESLAEQFLEEPLLSERADGAGFGPGSGVSWM